MKQDTSLEAMEPSFFTSACPLIQLNGVSMLKGSITLVA